MKDILIDEWNLVTSFDEYLTGGVSSVVNKFRPSSMLITASVDFVYYSRWSGRRVQKTVSQKSDIMDVGQSSRA